MAAERDNKVDMLRVRCGHCQMLLLLMGDPAYGVILSETHVYVFACPHCYRPASYPNNLVEWLDDAPLP